MTHRKRDKASVTANEFNEELQRLSLSAFDEFGDIADYIWKSPNLIESERKIELEKLNRYFPLTGDPEKDEKAKQLRRVRWRHEGRKLRGVFPYVMANGNLFTCISVFETYCLMLCKAIERRSGADLSRCKGSGVSKSFNFLSKTPIDLNQLAFREQVLIAILIRNCLFHANGILDWSRDESELRKVVARRSYLDTRSRSISSEVQEPDEIAIMETKLGDCLVISNSYPHIVSSYLKYHLIDMCKNAQTIVGGECTIQLPTSPYYFDPKSSNASSK
jgi:hypothetical protein